MKRKKLRDPISASEIQRQWGIGSGTLYGWRVVGGTDANGSEVTDGYFGPPALLNSVYGLCGLDVPTLKKLCTSQGKLFSRKRSGNCAAFQRAVKDAIKRARFMSLLPYVGE